MKKYLQMIFIGVLVWDSDLLSMRSGAKYAALAAKSAKSAVGTLDVPEFKSVSLNHENIQNSTPPNYGYRPSVVSSQNRSSFPGPLSNLSESQASSVQLPLYQASNGKYKTVNVGGTRVPIDTSVFDQAIKTQSKPVNSLHLQVAKHQSKQVYDSVGFDRNVTLNSSLPVHNNVQSQVQSHGIGLGLPGGGTLGLRRMPYLQSKQSVQGKQAPLLLTYDPEFSIPKHSKSGGQQKALQAESNFKIQSDLNQNVIKHNSVGINSGKNRLTQEKIDAFKKRPEAQAKRQVRADNKKDFVEVDVSGFNLETIPEIDRKVELLSNKSGLLKSTQLNSGIQKQGSLEKKMDSLVENDGQEQAQDVGEPDFIRVSNGEGQASGAQAISARQVPVARPTQKQQQEQSMYDYYTNKNQTVIPKVTSDPFMKTQNKQNVSLWQGQKNSPQFRSKIHVNENVDPFYKAVPAKSKDVLVASSKRKAGKKQLTPEEIEELKNRPAARVKRQMRAQNKKAFAERDMSDSNPEVIPGLNWKFKVEYENYMKNQSSWMVIRMLGRLKNFVLENLGYRPSATQKNAMNKAVENLAIKMNKRELTEQQFYNEIQSLALAIKGSRVIGSLSDSENMEYRSFSGEYAA